jgi:hypothetical protein
MIEFADEVFKEQDEVFGRDNMAEDLMGTVETFGVRAVAADYGKGLLATLIITAVAFTVKFFMKGGFNKVININ